MESIIALAITMVGGIAAGIWAWNWVSPESFLGGVAFIVVWAILARVLHYVLLLIFIAIFSDKR